MLNELIDLLEATALAQALRDAAWAIPLIQTIHILALAIVFSASLLLVLCTFGLLGDDWSPTRWSRRLGGWSWGGLIVLLLSGALMVAGEPARSLLNVLFQIKMALLIVATLVSWRLANRLQTAASTPTETRPHLSSKLLASSALTLWIAIICAGRWIAYYEG